MGAGMRADEVEDHAIQVDGGLLILQHLGCRSQNCDVFAPGGEGNQVRMWYKSIGFLLGNLASRWHANGTGNWLAKW